MYLAKDIKKETPLMKQYRDIKSKYPDSVLLFRVGDFYETFHDDAIIASKVLGFILTKRKFRENSIILEVFTNQLG